MEISNELQQELLEEIANSLNNNIPEHAITARHLAKKLGCSIRKANTILYEKYMNGELLRERKIKKHSRTYFYWKK